MTAYDTPHLFTFGFERSGTTLLSMMLGSHPQLAVPFSPTGLWYRYARRLSEYGRLHTPTDVDKLIHDILEEDRVRLWEVSLDFDELRSDLPPADFGAVVHRFHEIYAKKLGKPHWVLHDIATLYDMALANQWFPQARFVHIVRDPRDVALSHITYRYGSTNVSATAFKWRLAVETNLKMGAMIGNKRYLVLRYEDLITKPEETLRRLCLFAEVPYSDCMLSFDQTVDQKIPEDRRGLWPALSGRLKESNIAQWRKKLARYKVSAIEEIASDLLTELGYERHTRNRPSLMLEFFLAASVLGRGNRGQRLMRKLNLAK